MIQGNYQWSISKSYGPRVGTLSDDLRPETFTRGETVAGAHLIMSLIRDTSKLIRRSRVISTDRNCHS